MLFLLDQLNQMSLVIRRHACIYLGVLHHKLQELLNLGRFGSVVKQVAKYLTIDGNTDVLGNFLILEELGDVGNSSAIKTKGAKLAVGVVTQCILPAR